MNSGFNYSGIRDPHLDQLILDSKMAPSVAARQEGLRKVTRYLADKMYEIPTFSIDILYGTKGIQKAPYDATGYALTDLKDWKLR